MKFLTLSVLSLSLVGCSLFDEDIPSSKVPSLVKNAFDQAYANPVDVEWEKKKDHYEVDFEIDQQDHTALFNKEGQLLMSKQDIRKSELPAEIANNVSNDFPDRYIDDVDKIEKEGETLYQLELDGTPNELKIVYRADGQVEENFKYWD